MYTKACGHGFILFGGWDFFKTLNRLSGLMCKTFSRYAFKWNMHTQKRKKIKTKKQKLKNEPCIISSQFYDNTQTIIWNTITVKTENILAVHLICIKKSLGYF